MATRFRSWFRSGFANRVLKVSARTAVATVAGDALTLEAREPPVPLASMPPTTQIDQGPSFAPIDEALRELRAGRMIVVVDDEDRENEGDLTMAAEMITSEAINFMAKHGRGLICVAMTGERLKELEIGSMVPANSALGGTAFTVSIDLKRQDITTGISAYDRAETIKTAVNPNSHPKDFARPGHVFPLCARPGGVLERRGQTEAAVDLASLAGLRPAGVICEIINDDGTMARLPDLLEFCRKHELLMITVAELARYRFDFDYEGSLAGFEGMYPVCPRETLGEGFAKRKLIEDLAGLPATAYAKTLAIAGSGRANECQIEQCNSE